MRGLASLASFVAPALALAVAVPGCAVDIRDPDPGQVAALADEALRGLLEGHASETEIGHEIVDLRAITVDDAIDPARCDLVDGRLQTLCGDLRETGQAAGCDLTTAFYYAHVVPRCAVRFVVSSPTGGRMPRIYALDFTGAPLTGPEPLCGNGAVDAGEQCDDGNLELWDGCDSTCKTEEFEGCETVIEQQFADAGLARVDATTWAGKRSQLMVNAATALAPVTAATCAEADRVAGAVCDELQRQMPFVGGCVGHTELHDQAGAPACSVRFDVWFDGRAPDRGVFTTALTGELAFTIR